MTISIIAAVAANRVIGKEGDLPWHIPEDLKYFKRITMGKPVIMGRKTWETLDEPLPGRKNVVVTRQGDYQAEGAEVVHNLDDAIQAAAGGQEIMILGGSGIYEAALSRADRMYLTHIHKAFGGDTYFPEFNQNNWEVVEQTESETEDGELTYSFVVYERI
jgi:dihydrofolate reductase